MQVFRDTPAGLLENVVIGVDPDGTTHTYLYSYDLTPQELIDYAHGKEIDYTDKISSQPIDLDQDLIAGITAKNGGHRCAYAGYMRGGKEAGGQLYQTFDECASSAGDAGPCEWVLIIIKCSHKPGTDGRDDSEGGGGHNSNNTIPNNNSSGGIVIGTSPRGSGNSLDGDDRDPIEGNGSTITTPNINSSVQPLVLQSYLGIPHGSELFQWLVDYKNKEEVDILFDLGEQNKWNQETKNVNLTILNLLKDGKLNDRFDLAYYQALNPHFNVDTHNPLFAARLSAEMAILRFLHPKWSDTKIHLTAWWNLLKEPVHLLLDLGGLIPVVGEAADLVNGAIYLLEGDDLNASLSFAATIPFAGWAATGSKLAVKVVVTSGGKKAYKIIARGADEVAALGAKVASFKTAATNTINSIKNGARYGRGGGTGTYRQVAGHHPLAKKAFEGIDTYDLKEAFSVSKNKLESFDVEHTTITGKQNSLYSAWKNANPNTTMTIQDMATIEIQAMKQAGIPEDVATGWVVKALENLIDQGVSGIKNIPWNGINP